MIEIDDSVDESALFTCLLESADGNYTAVSSREKFTQSLKDVFAVSRAEPPPPPSSRRHRPSSGGSLPPPPVRRPSARTSDPPNAIAADEMPPRPPDSLIPVRFRDLMDESPEAARSTSRAPRNTMWILGAFVAGAALVLSAQALFSGARRAAATQAAPLPLPAAPAAPHAASPLKPTTSTLAVEPAPLPSAPPSAIAPAATEVVASAPGVTEPVKEAEPAPEGASDLAPSVSSEKSSEEALPKPAPVRHKRKRASSSPGYEPPTAEFPDPGK